MKIFRLILASLVAITSVMVFSPQAEAAFPSYTASIDSGSSVIRISVSNADPFAQIDFYGRQGSQLWTVMSNIGHADQSGFFSGSVNAGFYLNGTPIETYLLVNGISTGIVTLQSQGSSNPIPGDCFSQPWLCNNNGTLSASRTSVTLSRNNSTTVNFFPRFNQALFITSYPDTNVATASLSGNTLTIFGQRNGSTSVRVCTFNQLECASVFISVTGSSSGSTGRVTFVPSSVDLDQGQSRTVSLGIDDAIYPTNSFAPQLFYIASNSNSTDVSASISGNTLFLFARDEGTARIEVCVQQSNTRCNTLRVTVDDDRDDDNGNDSRLTFFPDRLSLVAGETRAAAGFNNGFESNLFLSRNSNSSVAAVSVNGNNITVRGLREGNTTLTICVSNQSNICNTLRVTVSQVLGSSTYSNGALVAVNSTIYQIYRNQKSGFANLQAFRDFGFRLENVLFVNNVNNIPTSSHIISTAQTSHPWGTWITMNNTIHFVHESGLIPVPSFDVFLANGGNSNLVVPANSYDFNLPMLSLMNYNDSRLR
jgi:hypothetical protein